MRCVEQRLTLRIIDGAAVVGIDQAEVGELGALIQVGHARHGVAEQRLDQRVGVCNRRQVGDEGGDLRDEARVGEDGIGEGGGGGFIGLVRGFP